MSGHGEKRSRQEEAALGALLAHPTLEAAAEQTGISAATLRRWLADAEFKVRYREARRQVLDQAVSGLQQAAGKAVGVLVEIAEDRAAPPAARVGAARAILADAFRGLEVLDLAARIEQLEHGRQGDESP